ncbi:hypothetical protein [uncultured Alistipes sp.]|uniref:hypothetical protein n=1 Tax=uncultured Alistipes sp. TaxID=538949 RepID=UPI0028038A02|nr:hypothetical protein [uncultured Alistipes sp.]
MKGKREFTESEIDRLRELIRKRVHATREQQKRIRDAMRRIGFYGQADWGIQDCQLEDLDGLIRSGQITVTGATAPRPAGGVPKPGGREQEASKVAQTDEEAEELDCSDLDFKSIDNLRRNGFSGFVSVAALRPDLSQIPDIRGVYMVVRKIGNRPQFRATGSGGHYKGTYPNVPIEKLRMNWVEETCVLYIGKAGDEHSHATLRSRLRQYLQFGAGKSRSHKGGRYIWQLENAEDLLFCWKPLPSGNPQKEETALLAAIKCQYEGRLPFANLKS